MIRFVDLSRGYWADSDDGMPVCAFLDTVDERFIENEGGGHTFVEMDDIRDALYEDTDHLAELVPDGFFREQEW